MFRSMIAAATFATLVGGFAAPAKAYICDNALGTNALFENALFENALFENALFENGLGINALTVQALRLIDEYRTYVASNVSLPRIDTNPFMRMLVHLLLTGELEAMGEELKG